MRRNKLAGDVLLWMFLSLIIFSPLTTFGQEAVQSEAVVEQKKEGFVTMDFKDADINTVLRLLSVKSGANIVAGPEVTGTVTARLENVPWEEALEVVLRTYGYVYEKKGNIIRVTTRENLALEELVTETFMLEYIQLSKKSQPTTPGAAAAVEEAGGKELLDIVTTMLSERGKVKMVTQRNALVVTDTPTHVYKIGQVISRLDQPTSQAYIDSKVVKAQLDKGENLGIRWNIASSGISTGSTRPTTFPFQTPLAAEGTDPFNFKSQLERFFPPLTGTAGTTATVATAATNTADPREFPSPAARVSNDAFAFGTLDFSSFSALLSMIESRSNTKVVSNPRIVVLNNQTAKVKVGSEIPIPQFDFNQQTASFQVTGFTYRDVGVVLNVTPHINSIEEILVDVRPEVSSLGSTISFTSTLAAPSFDVTNAETQVMIRSGETIAIGGLLEDKVAVSEQQIPYLSAIPFMGKLFRSKRQTEGSSNRNVETLFFITVTLVDTEGQPTGGKKDRLQVPVPSQETVGSQSVVKPPQVNLTPTKAGTG